MPPLHARASAACRAASTACQVAAPQRAAHLQPVEAGLGAKAHRLELAVHRLDEAGVGDLVDAARLARPKSSQAIGPAQVRGAGVRQQAELQRGEVAVADPARAALHAAREQLPVDAVEQARQAVAAAAWPSRSTARRRDAMERGQARRRRRRRSAGGAASAPASRLTSKPQRSQALAAPPQRAARAARRRPACRGQRVIGGSVGRADGSVACGVDRVRLASPAGSGRLAAVGRRRPARRPRSAARAARQRSSRSTWPQASASTPPCTSVWWFSAALANRSITEPAAPVFGSGAPNTTRLKRACISAIAHIAQGSSVTYSSQSGRR